jgi:hypothetical protein
MRCGQEEERALTWMSWESSNRRLGSKGPGVGKPHSPCIEQAPVAGDHCRKSTKTMAGTVLTIQELSGSLGCLLTRRAESSENRNQGHMQHLLASFLPQGGKLLARIRKNWDLKAEQLSPSVIYHQCKTQCIICFFHYQAHLGDFLRVTCVLLQRAETGGTCIASVNLPSL